MENSKAPKTKEERGERREEVLGFMKSIGPYSVPVNMLAKKYNCTVNTIYSDIKFLIRKIKFEDMSIEGRKILMSVTRNMSIADELKASGEAIQRLKGVMASNNTAEVLTKMFEQYGFKEKAAEKFQLESIGATFNLITKSVEEIKDAKDRSARARLSDKPEARGNNKSS